MNTSFATHTDSPGYQTHLAIMPRKKYVPGLPLISKILSSNFV